MANISQITLPSGTTYDIKDAWAREQIQNLAGGNAIVFKGVSSTVLTDGGIENPTVNDVAIKTKTTGDLYFYNKEEFIWGSDNKWHSLGPQLQALGDLAYKDSITVKYAKTTGVSSTFTGTSSNVSMSIGTAGTNNYTPAGTITGGAFSGSASTFSGTYTPEGSVSLTTSNKTATVSTTSGAVTYTPGGTVSTPTISVKTAGTTATIKNPTSVTVAKTVAAAAPTSTVSNEVTYYSVSNENLTLYKLGYTTGASITTTNVTVKTGDAAYQSNQPSFSGTGVRLITANIAVPTSASFSGTEKAVSTAGTPKGSVSSIGFSGTPVTISGTVTPKGSVSSTATTTNTNATVTLE